MSFLKVKQAHIGFEQVPAREQTKNTDKPTSSFQSFVAQMNGTKAKKAGHLLFLGLMLFI